MSTCQIELPDFDEIETIRPREPDTKDSLEILLGKTKNRVTIPLLHYQTQRIFSFSKSPVKNLN